MASNKRITVDEAGQKPTRSFFFDTNIWLFINGPFAMTRDARARTYSRLYRRILEGGGAIHTSETVVAEYVNRFTRYEFEALKSSSTMKFKDFRLTADYRDTVSTVKDTLADCLQSSHFSRCAVDWKCLEDMLTQMESGKSDLQDHLIAKTCEEHDLILVTDDGDYTFYGGVLCSANRKLL